MSTSQQLPWSEYIPTQPTAKQLIFLMLQQKEALFGGAAGGGKSEALLMAALQYANLPAYSALIIRKTFADLDKPGAIMDRAKEWLFPFRKQGVHWSEKKHSFTFPSGADLSFGFLDTANDKYKYQSSEFQFVGFDELTQFPIEDYLYLFSRLRRRKDSPIPLRVRSATNPGGMGAEWVSKRFGIKMLNNTAVGTDKKRPFIPSYLVDNQFLDQASYLTSLQELDPITRAQLLHGDWSAAAVGRCRREWARYYRIENRRWLLLGDRRYDLSQCRCFQTVDPAASVKEGPSGFSHNTRRNPSWSANGTWLLTPDMDLVLKHVWRRQCEIPDLLSAIQAQFREHRPEFVGIEANGLGIGVYQLARQLGLPVRKLSPRSGDKIVRFTDFATRMEAGKVWFPAPDSVPWMEDYERELYTWTGDPQQTADQIDVSSYAGIIVSQMVGSSGYQLTTRDAPSLHPYHSLSQDLAQQYGLAAPPTRSLV